MKENHLIVEQVSPFNVDTTVEKIIEVATQREWQNPATHNLQLSLSKSGKEVRPVQVVEICKSDYSGKMLDLNDERIVSVMMPCRISVYEKEDGKTYIALLNMGAMTEGLTPGAAAALKGASDESFEIVRIVVG